MCPLIKVASLPIKRQDEISQNVICDQNNRHLFNFLFDATVLDSFNHDCDTFWR